MYMFGLAAHLQLVVCPVYIYQLWCAVAEYAVQCGGGFIRFQGLSTLLCRLLSCSCPYNSSFCIVCFCILCKLKKAWAVCLHIHIYMTSSNPVGKLSWQGTAGMGCGQRLLFPAACIASKCSGLGLKSLMYYFWSGTMRP